uniref:G-protein coupled receptors family 1 profile domain-containing protein n=1 Tax=Cavia porcellus TaxID=10141 RepID=H0VWS9_CAVPO
MNHRNETSSSDFILLGLFSSSQASLVFFSSLFIIFILAITENTILIFLIHRDSRLRSPMYFLLSHLSFMDILHISNIVPKMITNFLSGSRTITFAGCGFQIFLSLTLLGSECLLLVAMSYDRYVSICHPLRYAMLMSDSVSVLMAAGSCKSSEARKKSFSTCSFHMVVVVMYYGPFIFTYMRPKSYHTPGQDKFLAIFYTILTPTLNPVIYSFRNKDVQKALKAMKSMLINNLL